MAPQNALAVANIERRPEMAVVVDDWTDERTEFIRRTYCAGAPDAIAESFIGICRRRRLAPEEKHIYLTKRGTDFVIQTGIDGYRLIADRTGQYVGSDEPVYDVEDAEHPNRASVTVWKLVGGQRYPFTASARWNEYAPQDQRQGFMWKRMPYLMLGKVCEALALRKAFPAELSGILTDSEMDQAGPDDRSLPTATVRTAREPALPAGSEDAPAPPLNDRDAFRRRFFALAGELGIVHDDTKKALCTYLYPDAGSRANYTASMWADAVAWLQDEAHADTVAHFRELSWLARIEGCRSEPALAKLAGELGETGQATDAVRGAFRVRRDEIQSANRMDGTP